MDEKKRNWLIIPEKISLFLPVQALSWLNSNSNAADSQGAYYRRHQPVYIPMPFHLLQQESLASPQIYLYWQTFLEKSKIYSNKSRGRLWMKGLNRSHNDYDRRINNMDWIQSQAWRKSCPLLAELELLPSGSHHQPPFNCWQLGTFLWTLFFGSTS